jgi:hypothetical protein
MGPLLNEPAISLRVQEHEEPRIEVRVNFGVFAGRHATPAEIDELAGALKEFVPEFTVVAEDRHEFADAVEAALHQVVVAVAQEHAGDDPDLVAEKIVLAANGWALDCIASRHGGGEL